MYLVARSHAGLSLVEVVVALAVTSVGLGAVAGSVALVTRMVGRGAVETRAAQVAESRIEQLRAAAGSATPRCASALFTAGGPLSTQQVTERWEIAPAGASRDVRVIVWYQIPGGIHADTVATRIDC